MNKLQSLMFILWIMMLMIIFILSTNYFHPSILMFSLIIYSTIICMNMSLWKSNFLYSIMMFLIMISGLFIIFLYFSSLISNEQMKFYMIKNLWISFMLNLMFFIYLIMTNSFLNKFINIYIHNFKEIYSINFNCMKPFQNILFIYQYPFNYMSIYCMMYLLIVMFSIIKICSFKSSTLRKIN